MQRDTADGISCSIRDGEGRVETTQGICVNISHFIETKKMNIMSSSLLLYKLKVKLIWF